MKMDDEMFVIIPEKANERCREILTTLWYEETKREEDISMKRLKTKNEIWLKKYKTEFGTKYAEKNPFIDKNQIKSSVIQVSLILFLKYLC